MGSESNSTQSALPEVVLELTQKLQNSVHELISKIKNGLKEDINATPDLQIPKKELVQIDAKSESNHEADNEITNKPKIEKEHESEVQQVLENIENSQDLKVEPRHGVTDSKINAIKDIKIKSKGEHQVDSSEPEVEPE